MGRAGRVQFLHAKLTELLPQRGPLHHRYDCSHPNKSITSGHLLPAVGLYSAGDSQRLDLGVRGTYITCYLEYVCYNISSPSSSDSNSEYFWDTQHSSPYPANSSNTKINALLASFYIESVGGAQMKINIGISSFLPSGDVLLMSQRDSSNQMVYSMRYTVVWMNPSEREMAGYILGSYVTTLNNTLPMTSPTSFGISTFFSDSPSGGFDGYCLLGIFSLAIAGGTLGTRAAMFDIHSQSFSGLNYTIP
jgi:hypothetical protein